MNQPPPPFDLGGTASVQTPSRRQQGNSEMSTLQDFSNLSLTSPSEDIFRNQNQVQHQNTMTPTPLGRRESYFSGHRPTPDHYPHPPHHHHQPHSRSLYPMAQTPTRPQNMPTPSRYINSAPRTPDPAAMQGGAFADMGLNNSASRTTLGNGVHSMALVRVGEVSSQYLGLAPKFERFFFMAERYAYSHMNFPSSARDSQLPPGIKERLMRAATRESAHQLGSTGATRSFLMAKIIIQWIIKHIFRQSLFTSFDLEADRRIASFKDNLYQNTPPLVRSQMLTEISEEIQQIRNHPDFPSFLETLVEGQIQKLWCIVHPLMHQHTSMDRADLKTLMYEAYRVAGDMAATPVEWRFDFAPIGSNYNPSMINRDPYTQGHEEDLARRGLLIRLGFIPAVYLRDSAGGNVRTEQLTRQHILLKG